MPKLALFAALALVYTASHASTCDELRAQIEGKIKAAGVASFAVTVVDSAASAPGKVVGTCDKGAKKILYVQSPAPLSAMPSSPVPGSATPAAKPVAASPGTPSKTSPNAPPASPPASKAKAKTPDAAILTECKDGSTSIGGTCKP